jgi:hypothetical protein
METYGILAQALIKCSTLMLETGMSCKNVGLWQNRKFKISPGVTLNLPLHLQAKKQNRTKKCDFGGLGQNTI